MCLTLKSLLSVYSAPRERKCACWLAFALSFVFPIFFKIQRELEEGKKSQSLEGQLLVRDCFCLTDDSRNFVFHFFFSHAVIGDLFLPQHCSPTII